MKPYSLPYAKWDVITQEINSMLALYMIEKAESLYSSPIVLVQYKYAHTDFVCTMDN